uniref:Uncharacterized protein n=1 Tax=Oryza rufipogon TaxID=4529 RepID=A0A0E0MY93_ORYRU
MFSMDGDFAPLLELIKLHRMYGLLLVMDVPWTVGDHCDVGVIGLTKCSGTHGLLPCFDTFLLVSIQRETICVHPLDFMIWPQVKGKCTNLATKATPTRNAIDEVTERGARPSRRSLQGGEQRQKPLPTPAHNWTGFSPKGRKSPQDNTSKEETAPAGVDVADPGRPDRAFAEDSLKRCRTSKKPKQKC